VTYAIEAVPLDGVPAELLEDVCKRLNAVQPEFTFGLPTGQLRNDGVTFTRQNYIANDVFTWLLDARIRVKGNHPYLIAFVQGPLQSATTANLFGSHDAQKGLAVVTLHDHIKFVSSPRAYVAYFLVRYAISFFAPDMKGHEETRGCFFDKKENKYHLRESLLEGKFCDPCMAKLQAVLTPEIVRAIQSMATLIHNLEVQPEIVTPGVAQPQPAPVTDVTTAAADVPNGSANGTNDKQENEKRLENVKNVDENRGKFPWGNAILSLVALAVGVGIVILLQHSNNALGNALLYFAAVLTLSIAASLVVFGVLRGYARYTGKVENGTLELGGSAVVLVLVLILGFKLTPPQSIESSTFNITVHARDEKQRPVINGRLLMTVGQETKPAVLNKDGEGTFKEISNMYRGRKVPIEAQVPQCTLREPNKVYELVPGVITVELQSHPDDPLDALVSADPAKYAADILVQTLSSEAGGIVVAPELLSRLKKKRVLLQAPLRDVPLGRAFEQIFAQIGVEVVYERSGSILKIRSKSGGTK